MRRWSSGSQPASYCQGLCFMFLLGTAAKEGVGEEGGGQEGGWWGVLCIWDLGSAVYSRAELNPLTTTTSIFTCFVSSL